MNVSKQVVTEQTMAQENCTRCGYTLAPEDKVCPKCKLPIRRETLTPLDGTPTSKPTVARPRDMHQEREDAYRPEYDKPVEGQESPGNLGYIKFIAKQDPLLASVFAMLAIMVLMAIASGGITGAIIPAVVFWGVYTFQMWGYWLALAGSGLGVLQALYWFSYMPAAAVVGGVLSLFIIIILLRRKAYFG